MNGFVEYPKGMYRDGQLALVHDKDEEDVKRAEGYCMAGEQTQPAAEGGDAPPAPASRRGRKAAIQPAAEGGE